MEYKKIILLFILLLNFKSTMLAFQDRPFDAGSSSHHAAIGFAAAVGAAGLYGYNKYYVQPTPAIVDDASAFILSLIKNPIRFYTLSKEKGPADFGSLGKQIEHKKQLVERALGLTQSFANMQNYLPTQSGTIRLINHLFTLLESATKKTLKQFTDDSELQKDIRIDSIELYIQLQQAKNNYAPATLANLIKEVVAENGFGKKYFSTIPNKTGEIKALLMLYNYAENPDLFKCPETECTSAQIAETISEIDKQEQTFIKDLYGGMLYRFLTTNQAKKMELIEINKLFKLFKDSIYIANDGIEEQINKCLLLVVNRLPVNLQWSLITNYLEAIHGVENITLPATTTTHRLSSSPLPPLPPHPPISLPITPADDNESRGLGREDEDDWSSEDED